ncbi:MAG: hypothetical protein C0594_09570 [Marinilabiliales bacterium]|nr:MAG: hypothetical protein C0594_09570 [Marinilabiliales bacterium]
MSEVLEILKYTVPALVVFITAYFILKSMLDKEVQKHRIEIVMNNQKIITPIRLQAYERLSLFLERIALESLIMRTQQPKMTVGQLQSRLISSIRTEFDHNLSQQVYVSVAAWGVIKNAKENLIQMINAMAGKMDTSAPAMDLSKALLEQVMQMDVSPTKEALTFLKKEISGIF